MTASDPPDLVLADTNIVVYAYDPTDQDEHQLAKQLLRTLSEADRLVLTSQVLNEFCAVMMRRTQPSPLTAAQAAAVVRSLTALGPVMPLDAAATVTALDGMDSHGFSFWDALLWATAR